MKYLLLFLLISSQAFAQQQVESKYVRFKTPGVLSAIPKTPLKTNPETDKILNLMRNDIQAGHRFLSTGSIKFFQYIDTAVSVGSGYIPRIKGILDNMSTFEGAKIPGYSSKVKDFNNLYALITTSDIDDIRRYNIFMVNKSYNRLFSSIILVVKNDPLAENAVNDLLNSVTFK